jgi:hypothetical protein
MQNAVAIPTAATNAFMQFWHKHRFEDDTVPFDGGVVEYSTDNGTTWADAGMLMIEGQYNGVILAGADNPLGGRQGYTNRSPAWPNFNRVTLSLNTLRGQSVKFRFRHGADQNTALEGWWVDDVTIITQEACATVSVTPGGSTPTVTHTSITMTPMTSTPTVTPGGPTFTATRTSIPTTSTPIAGTGTPTACSIMFTDVPQGHTFYAEIRCLACRGIVSGYADGKFRPDNLVTRSQLAKIVSNAAGLNDNPGPQIFQDVPPDNPFYEWINRLTLRGYMTGYNCGSPGEPCVNNRHTSARTTRHTSTDLKDRG